MYISRRNPLHVCTKKKIRKIVQIYMTRPTATQWCRLLQIACFTFAEFFSLTSKFREKIYILLLHDVLFSDKEKNLRWRIRHLKKLSRLKQPKTPYTPHNGHFLAEQGLTISHHLPHYLDYVFLRLHVLHTPTTWVHPHQQVFLSLLKLYKSD